MKQFLSNRLFFKLQMGTVDEPIFLLKLAISLRELVKEFAKLYFEWTHINTIIELLYQVLIGKIVSEEGVIKVLAFRREMLPMFILVIHNLAGQRYSQWVEHSKPLNHLPVRLSTSTSWSMNVIMWSGAEVVDVWSMKLWFHFSFCSKFRWSGIFLRYECDAARETEERSMLSLLSLISPMRRNDHTAKMKRNLKKFLWKLFILGCSFFSIPFRSSVLFVVFVSCKKRKQQFRRFTRMFQVLISWNDPWC